MNSCQWPVQHLLVVRQPPFCFNLFSSVTSPSVHPLLTCHLAFVFSLIVTDYIEAPLRCFYASGEGSWWALKRHIVNGCHHRRWDQIWSSEAAANKMCLKRVGSLFSCVSLWESKTKMTSGICVVIYCSVPSLIRCHWIIIFRTPQPCRPSTFRFLFPICVSLQHKRRQHCLFWQNEANVFISGRWMMSKRHICIHLGARRRRTHL